jgi:hypothetical protein
MPRMEIQYDMAAGSVANAALPNDVAKYIAAPKRSVRRSVTRWLSLYKAAKFWRALGLCQSNPL